MSKEALHRIAEAKITKATTLNLNRCGIIGCLPMELAELTWLEELDLLGNNLGAIPNHPLAPFDTLTGHHPLQALSQLEGLRKLDLSQTKILGIEPLSNLKRLQVLHLHGTSVSDIDSLKGLENLIELRLSNTNISEIGSLIGLRRLQILALSGTQVAEIDPLKELFELQILSLSDTRVSDIRPLERLNQLHSLFLSNTSVADITPIRGLTDLHTLSIPRTQVTDISPLKDLVRLQILSLSDTPIMDITPLRGLINLQILYLSRTMVTDISPLSKIIERGIPVKMADYNGQNGISLKKCPLQNPPLEIAQQGNAAILAYWREQDRVGIEKATELKLFLLGNTTAGKSTLAHALIYQRFPKETASTIGANLSQKWQLKEHTVNLWDFGGQEYFHATHRLLMSDDAVYIVVVDPHFNQNGYHKTSIQYSDEAEPIDEDLEHFPHGYWLEIIHLHASNSSAMVLWNKLDQENCPKYGLSDADKALFDDNIREYPISLKGTLEEAKNPVWQNKWQVFHDDLRQKVTETLQGKQVIQYWSSVREAIAERSKADIRLSWVEFEKLCKADDPLRELGNIVIYLRNMCGAILYFPDHPMLKHTVFINPNKINEFIYAILNRKVKKAGGRFEYAKAVEQVKLASKRLNGITLDSVEAETFTIELIEVMKQFDIIFETGKDSSQYVAPQYLKPEVPKEVAFALKNVKVKPAFAIQFKSFVPRHIVPQFISKNGSFALDEGYWKLGLFFSRDETAVQLRVDYNARTIFVDAAITDGRNGVLRGLFQELRWLIARDGGFAVAVADGSFVDYELLLEDERKLASRVKNIDGQYQDISDFKLFMHQEVAGELAAVTKSPKHYVGNIIRLLQNAFNAIDFETFTLVHFEGIYREFTSGMTQQHRILLLVAYVQNYGKLDDLLAAVKSVNPYQYAQCEPYYQ